MPRKLSTSPPPCTQEAQDLVATCERLALGQAKRAWILCGGAVELEELRGEALLALVDAGRRYRSDRKTRFSTYAHRVIVHRLCKMLHSDRSRRPIRSTVLSKLTREDGSPVEPEGSRELPPIETAASNELVRELLRWLPPLWRELVVAHVFESRTYEEIGTAYGISRQRVQQLLAKSFAKLRGALLRLPGSRRPLEV